MISIPMRQSACAFHICNGRKWLRFNRLQIVLWYWKSIHVCALWIGIRLRLIYAHGINTMYDVHTYINSLCPTDDQFLFFFASIFCSQFYVFILSYVSQYIHIFERYEAICQLNLCDILANNWHHSVFLYIFPPFEMNTLKHAKKKDDETQMQRTQ